MKGPAPKPEAKNKGAVSSDKQGRFVPIFYRVLLAVLLIGAILVAIGLNQLNDFLKDYESSQHKYVAQDVYISYFTEDTYHRLLDYLDDMAPSPYESHDMLETYLTEHYGSSERSYQNVTSDIDGKTVRYIVKVGSVRFAEFTLTANEKTPKWGNPVYTLSDMKLLVNIPSHTVTVKVPSDCSVTVNGVALTADTLTEAEIRTPSCDHMPEGVEGLIYQIHTLKGLLQIPNIVVTDRYYRTLPLKADESGLNFEAVIESDAALERDYSEFVIDTVKKYAAFMQADGYFSSFSGRLDPSSVLYRQIAGTPVGFVWPHNGYDFENEAATDFYAYDDNTFSCRVSVVHILHKYGQEDYRDYIDMVVYLRKIDGDYRIYDWVIS